MPKHYHESRGEQINNKLHGIGTVHGKNMHYTKRESTQIENILKEEAVHYGSIQSRADDIHHEKGGAVLDNWLEAERILGYDHII